MHYSMYFIPHAVILFLVPIQYNTDIKKEKRGYIIGNVNGFLVSWIALLEEINISK